ncbi:MAG: POTRA domain-containing protein [Acidobacteriaceae bacterium]
MGLIRLLGRLRKQRAEAAAAMRVRRVLVAVLLAGSGLGLPAAGQVYFPETITFSGSSVSQGQLLAYTGLRPGRVTKEQMDAAAKKLTDSGLFFDARYELNDDVLRYTLTTSPAVLPVRYDNFPWWDAKTLTALVGQKVPLFGGELYPGGPMRLQVVSALTELVAAQGVQAKIGTAPIADAHGTILATRFRMDEPQIEVASLAVEGAGGEEAEGIEQVAASAAGKPFRRETLKMLAGKLRDVYTREGKLETGVTEPACGMPRVVDGRILVPLTAKISTDGAVYTVSAVQFAGDAMTSSASFAKVARIRAGDVADEDLVDETAGMLKDPWKEDGYEDVQVSVMPALDPREHTVSYTFATTPGPRYAMGKLTLVGLNKRQEREVRRYWQLADGSVYRPALVPAWYGIYSKERGEQLILADGLEKLEPVYESQWHEDAHTVDVTVTFHGMKVVPNQFDVHPGWK